MILTLSLKNFNMDLLKGSYQKIIDVLSRAELRIIIAMPNLSIELARLLEELHNRIKSISVFMDIREESYRAIQ